nr:TIGR03936 family radical SAM-associated protein [Salsipaludibacter albus]
MRIRYTKQGRVRFISARDLSSVWERALRRAEIPIAYSQGFTPHPKVSFPDALPVGYASTGEYAELTLATDIDPGTGLARLSAALPTGMDITTYLVVPDGARRFAKYLQATLWDIAWEPDVDTTPDLVDDLRHRADALLASDAVEVVRHRPKGDRILDVRPPLVDVAVDPGDPSEPRAIFRAVLRNDGPTIRPTDLKVALDGLADHPLPDPRLYTRVAQGAVVDDGVVEALTQQVEPLTPGRHAEAA